MDGITVLIMLSIAILVLLIFIILRSSKADQTKKTDESLTLLDRSFERQETKLNDLADQLIEFNKPLDKLNRYLSGGTQAGKFGEWSLESIISDILPTNQYEKNAETISGSGKRVEFAIKLPEGLLMPIDAKFPSGLYDGYLEATRSGDDKLVKNSLNEIRRKVLSDAEDINTKYIQSGITTDMGVMFIPSEALLQLIDTIDKYNNFLILTSNKSLSYLDIKLDDLKSRLKNCLFAEIQKPSDLGQYFTGILSFKIASSNSASHLGLFILFFPDSVLIWFDKVYLDNKL